MVSTVSQPVPGDGEDTAVHGTFEGYPVIQVEVNGQKVEGDVPAVNLSDRTMVPLRFVSEAMGAVIGWDGETYTALVETGEIEVMDLLFSESHWEEVVNLAYSPDGDTIAVGAREVDLYSVSNRQIFASGSDMDYGDRPESRSMSFFPDGSVLAAAWRGVSFHDATDLSKLAHFHGGGEARIAVSPDATMLASHETQLSGELLLWEKTGELEYEQVAQFNPDADMIHDVAFSPDGQLVAGGFRDGVIMLWDTETHSLEGEIAFDSTGGNFNLTFSPDGKMLAASEPDLGSEIHLVNLEDGSRQVLDPESRVWSMEFSPEGDKLAYGTTDGDVVVLDTGNWSVQHSKEHEDRIEGLVFSPDGKNLAIASDAVLYYYEFVEE